MFKVIIYGGNKTDNFRFFKEKCIFYLRNKAQSGNGIIVYTNEDKFNEEFCTLYGIPRKVFYTNWKLYDKKAVAKRNNEMLKDADALIIFDDGSKEISFMIDMAKEKKIQTRIVNIKNKIA